MNGFHVGVSIPAGRCEAAVHSVCLSLFAEYVTRPCNGQIGFVQRLQLSPQTKHVTGFQNYLLCASIH